MQRGAAQSSGDGTYSRSATLQIWNGQALSLSDAKQLETDINKFLQGDGWKGFEKARELFRLAAGQGHEKAVAACARLGG